jgi:nucleotide-binding universal stress UspA family protein
MVIRCLLCPVDFSDFSRRALHYADALAVRYGADLYVLHVYLEVVPPAVPLEVPNAPNGGSAREATIGALSEFAKGAGVTREVRRVARPGLPVQGILDYAAEIRTDLIVLGTHGRSGLDRALLGSTAERVLHKATCPVLTVPGAAPESVASDRPLFTHVLCAVDFSPATAPAVEHGFSLARDLGAKLTLLHVMEMLSDHDARTWAEHRVWQFVEMRREQTLEKLRQLVPDEARPQCQCCERVELGSAARAILRVADHMHADLIVMGPQGLSGAGPLVFGSTTQTVLRHAACPVLTVCGCVPLNAPSEPFRERDA